MGLGYFVPALYLSSYAVVIGLSPLQGASLLAMMSVAQVLGQLTFGYCSDRRASIEASTTVSSLVAATVILGCWGIARTFASLVVFAITFGFFGSGYTAIWARIGTSSTSDVASAFTVYGLLNFGKGVSNILTGPIGGALVGGTVSRSSYGATRYERVIVFAGSCMLLSGVTVMLYAGRHSLKMRRT